MESPAEIEEKLSLYRGQLAQVEELLAYDKANEQFLRLKDDLRKVVTLTLALKEQAVALQANPVAPPSLEEETGSKLTDEGGLPADGGDDDESRPLRVGDRVEVLGGEHPFPAVVTAVLGAAEVKVKYFAYDAEVVLPVGSLQRLARGDLSTADVVVGLKCQCKYAVDQQFYDAVVTSETDRGFVVTFSEYGNAEEVPLEYLRHVLVLAKDGAQGGAHGKTDKGKVESDEKKIIPIPDKLKILPTDTEEEKARKKKKIKIIKNHNRQVEQEMESTQVAQSWQKFVHKKTTKRALTGIPKAGSMFASSEGGRVGVMNSGKAMTNFIERKKYKFDEQDGGSGEEE